jgi:hypothetical protein
MGEYQIIPESSTDHHPWSDVSPHEACQKMTNLLQALTSNSSHGIPRLTEQLKPFDIKEVAWNNEYLSLMEKVQNAWELGSEDGINTHELLQFYGLVVGTPNTVRLPFITTIGDHRVSWFIRRPNTEVWTSVQANMRSSMDGDEQFARTLLYHNRWSDVTETELPFFARCTSFSPKVVPRWGGSRPLTASRTQELMGIVHAGNVLGPRHDTTKRIVALWIRNLLKKNRKNKDKLFEITI